MTLPNPAVAMARVILDELARNGVVNIVVAPGSRSAALSMAAVDMGLRVHVEIDERSAGFHALGLGKGGSPAAVVTTSGTAVANLLPAVVEADLSAVPLVILSADRPPELRERGANQTIRQQGIFGSSVRWEFDPGPAEDRPGSNALWRSMVSRAVQTAVGGPAMAGPVHLNLPFREPLVPASDDGRDEADPFANDTSGRPDGHRWTETTVRQKPILNTRGETSRVLAVIGDDPSDSRLSLDGVAYVAEPHARVGRMGALTSLHYLATHARSEIYRPEGVVTVGRVGLSRPLSTWLRSVPTTRIDPSGRWVDTSAEAANMVLSRDIPLADPAWLDGLRRIDEAVGAAVRSALDSLPTMSEPRIARDTARALPENGRLVVASSMPIRDLDLFMDAPDVDVLANRGASGIDGFVSTVLGVAASTPDRPTVALAGDLSMLHDTNGLLVSPRPDCVFVVINNDGGGIFSMLPQADYPESFERVFGTPHGRSFEYLARLHDLSHHHVDDPERLEETIKRAVAEPGVSLVVAETDRHENVELHRRLTGVAHTAIDEAIE